ncbi:MAG: hypothetical protein AAGG02_16985 [Cyanobacteria bacterium P01_H01_bin.15]
MQHNSGCSNVYLIGHKHPDKRGLVSVPGKWGDNLAPGTSENLGDTINVTCYRTAQGCHAEIPTSVLQIRLASYISSGNLQLFLTAQRKYKLG